MEQLLKELLEKADRIAETQQEIMDRLDQSVIYPKIQEKNTAAKTKKEEEKEAIEEYKQLLIHGPRIREKYNLVSAPQSNRILAYLRTGNPAIFDGLKRRN